jgi:hypothetical protein
MKKIFKKYAGYVLFLLSFQAPYASATDPKTEQELLEQILTNFVLLHSNSNQHGALEYLLPGVAPRVKLQHHSLHLAFYDKIANLIILAPNLVDIFLLTNPDLKVFELVLLHELGHAQDPTLLHKLVLANACPFIIGLSTGTTSFFLCGENSVNKTAHSLAAGYIKRSQLALALGVSTYGITAICCGQLIRRPLEIYADTFAAKHISKKNEHDLINKMQFFIDFTTHALTKKISFPSLLEAAYNANYIFRDPTIRDIIPNDEVKRILSSFQEKWATFPQIRASYPYKIISLCYGHPSSHERDAIIAREYANRTEEPTLPSLQNYLCQNLLEEQDCPERKNPEIKQRVVSFKKDLERFGYYTVLHAQTKAEFEHAPIFSEFGKTFTLQNMSYEQRANAVHDNTSIYFVQKKNTSNIAGYMRFQTFEQGECVYTLVTSTPHSSLGLFLLQHTSFIQ